MGFSDALNDYTKFQFGDGRWTRDVYRRGSGPAVIVIHEMPGLHPQVIRFADHVAAAGMTVFCPVLFGVPGRPATHPGSALTMLGGMCVRWDFNAWASGKSSPIVAWLKALARKAHAECGGRGVGAVGMCLTGGFALAMMTEASVVAPVLSQPSLPAAMSKKAAAGIDAAPQEVRCARTRFESENLSMIGLRFKSDRSVPDARFDTYRREFGDKFEAIELEDADAAAADRPPHSVLTIHLREDGPTKAAEQRVIAFFKDRMGA